MVSMANRKLEAAVAEHEKAREEREEVEAKKGKMLKKMKIEMEKAQEEASKKVLETKGKLKEVREECTRRLFQ